ncbi:carboxylesterase/lipase family protein [Acutalibacter caecimuris]|uniref:carboxylesterase/lipase family protein n=1 Tax=Acutalibacter caecimuris TaxID=3093657 RepID=UPI002AC8B5A3|nr:carboxylesterase family protein [Acutalibacter sp. M00118]
MKKEQTNNFTVTDFEHAKVKVKQGWVQGYTEEAPNGTLKIFKGLPFAAPPVGDLRFRRPQDPGCWRGVRRATQYSAAAVQEVQELGEAKANVHGVPQMLAPSQYEEDCLYLNVWSPAETQDEKLPVFIWVHGGGMNAGSGVEVVCTGEGLTGRKKVVMVTINYRLNLFGFFAHPDLAAEEEDGTYGNYGLYDIRKACQWVKENIAAFGGDPENITVGGQSGGARATGSLLVSPLMEGLVQHISVESGFLVFGQGGPCPREQAEAASQWLMEAVGAKTIDDLRKKDAWELFDAYQAGQRPGVGNPFGNSIRYCVDGTFIPDDYFKLLTEGRINDFDVMIGSCAQEMPVRRGAGLPVEEYIAHLNEHFAGEIQALQKWYAADDPVQAEKACSTLSSDLMAMGSLYIGMMCHKYGKRAFVWQMNKENETQRGHELGCPHCAEMPYVFGRVDTGERDPFFPYHWVGADYDFMELIQDYWTSFMKTGDPNTEGRPAWKAYENNGDVCVLGNDTHMMSPEEQEKLLYLFAKVTAEGKDPKAVSTYGMPKLN